MATPSAPATRPAASTGLDREPIGLREVLGIAWASWVVLGPVYLVGLYAARSGGVRDGGKMLREDSPAEVAAK
jgi:hypothetical protein